MGQLTFPIVGRDLVVGVRVNLDAAALAVIQAAGGPAPASVPTSGEIDTGSNVTAVSPAILKALGAQKIVPSTTQGVGGSVAVGLYRVSLAIVDPNRPTLPPFLIPDLLVMDMPAGVPLDVLIGMDVLLNCRMLVDGPARQLTIDF